MPIKFKNGRMVKKSIIPVQQPPPPIQQQNDEDEEVKKPVPTSKSILQDIKKMKIEEKSHKSVSDESRDARLKKFVSLKVI